MMVLLTEDGGESGLNFEQFLSLVCSALTGHAGRLLRGRGGDGRDWICSGEMRGVGALERRGETMGDERKVEAGIHAE